VRRGEAPQIRDVECSDQRGDVCRDNVQSTSGLGTARRETCEEDVMRDANAD
jgi:hypothetical protein